MSKVFVTTYEVIGAHEIAHAHYQAIDAARLAHWDFVTEVGGAGFRPSHNGGVRSVFFEQLPSGWRKIGLDGAKVEAVPLKSTKSGKAMAENMAALPQAPKPGDLASSYGYNPPHFAIDGGKIYFPTEMQVYFPVERIFLRLPRFAEDGFEPDEAILHAIPESQFMAAIEAHNAEAKRQREGGAA